MRIAEVELEGVLDAEAVVIALNRGTGFDPVFVDVETADRVADEGELRRRDEIRDILGHLFGGILDRGLARNANDGVVAPEPVPDVDAHDVAARATRARIFPDREDGGP